MNCKMKFSWKFLLVGTLAVIAIFSREIYLPPASRAPASPETASAPASPAPPLEPAPVPMEVKQPQSSSPSIEDVSASAFDNTLASLHAKLRQWQESQVNSPDDVEGRDRLLQEMLAMVTDENVAKIIQSLSAKEMSTPFGTGALHHWMQLDPVTASNWLASRPDTTEDETLAVAEDWAGHGDGLRQYLDQLPDTAWKQSLLQDAGSEMSFKDPLEAVKLAQQMKPGDLQTNLMRAVACGWISTDPGAALDWINGVNDPSLREQLVASAAQSYALTDPAQAMAWLASSVKSDQTVKDSTLNIIQTWATKDPAAAANLVGQFPDGDTKTAAADIISKYWQQTDPVAARTWIQNLADSPTTPAN
jgi:hypothetical protein